MNKQKILNYILNLYNKLIKEYGECNDFPVEYPENLHKEGHIIKMIKFKPNYEIIFIYKITNHWYSTDFNNTHIKISLCDKNEDLDDIIDKISMITI